MGSAVPDFKEAQPENAVPPGWRSGHQLVTVFGSGENTEVIVTEGDRDGLSPRAGDGSTQ